MFLMSGETESEAGAQPGLEVLRAQIRALERGTAAARVLPLGALHEVEGVRAEWDDGAAAGFCLALVAPLAAALAGPLLWVARRAQLHGAGLAALGLDPGRFVLVEAGGDREALWAMEEGLRCGRPSAVVGEVAALGRTAGRRLQLAAEAAGVTAFLLRRRLGPPRRAEPPSAALTRWRVAPLASGPAPLECLPGRPRWRVELRRCRGAAPGDFLVEWDDASGGIALAAALRDGPLGPQPAQTGGPLARLAG